MSLTWANFGCERTLNISNLTEWLISKHSHFDLMMAQVPPEGKRNHVSPHTITLSSLAHLWFGTEKMDPDSLWTKTMLHCSSAAVKNGQTFLTVKTPQTHPQPWWWGEASLLSECCSAERHPVRNTVHCQYSVGALSVACQETQYWPCWHLWISSCSLQSWKCETVRIDSEQSSGSGLDPSWMPPPAQNKSIFRDDKSPARWSR